MKKCLLRKFVVITTVFFFVLSAFANLSFVKADSADVEWAKSTVVAPRTSFFNSVVTDTDGNIYAAGYINNTGEYDFGNDVTVSGNFSQNNAVIVKYNSSGEAQWAKSTVVGPSISYFNSVAVDNSGNVYCAGIIYYTDQFDFGNDVTVSGVNSQQNAVLVKYNSSGEAQWAKSTVVGPDISEFKSVATDTSGNAYAVGYINGSDEFDFGDDITISGANAGNNAMFIKYNSSGEAQWAKSTVVGPGSSAFMMISIDTSNNIYMAGNISGNSQFDFGDDITVSGGYTSANAIVIRYNTSGSAVWAKSTAIGPSSSTFYSIAVDQLGYIYCVGSIYAKGEFDFGDDVKVSGNYGADNAVLVKYNNTGVAQWAKSTVTAPNTSIYNSVSTDTIGDVYTVGYINSTNQFDFGNDVTVNGANSGSNVLLVKYNKAGDTEWAKSTVTAPNQSRFSSVHVNTSGDIYTTGYIIGNGQYDFGDSVTLNGGYTSTNALLVNYYDEIAVPDPTPEDLPLDTTPPVFDNFEGGENGINVSEEQFIDSNPYMIKTKPSDENGISKVEFYIDDNLICTDLTPDSLAIYSCDWDTSKYHSVVKVIAYDSSNNHSQIIRNTVVAPSLYLTELPRTGK